MEIADALKVISKINSKDNVMQLLRDSYNYKDSKKLPEDMVKNHSQVLGIDMRETAKVIRSLGEFSDQAVYECWKTSEEAGVSSESREGQIIFLALAEWKSLASNSLIGGPKLISFSTEVCPRPSPRFSSEQSQSEGNSVSRSQKGGQCLLNLKIQENPSNISTGAEVTDVTLELPKDVLDKLVHGLSHVRSQLSSVAKNT
ncbi:COMM domain-containing protein 9-like [Ischnura elegans]|uniref:COMM domain-containing protein 9-like n=1 Tax=Ischnura elegans TaxID=197161 RepID=UPI001ED89A27|nr:COMM domain-containing protein 9-like [Ischnura elegans]